MPDGERDASNRSDDRRFALELAQRAEPNGAVNTESVITRATRYLEFLASPLPASGQVASGIPHGT